MLNSFDTFPFKLLKKLMDFFSIANRCKCHSSLISINNFVIRVKVMRKEKNAVIQVLFSFLFPSNVEV